jgi:uncharacterized protein YjiS (DUF1127 family)
MTSLRPFRAIGKAFRSIASELRTQHIIRELHQLDDNILKDIGVVRDRIASDVRHGRFS